MKNAMKKLCRIRLINWHYFHDETIAVNGSFLVTGENSAGKSTLLDAIQLILTTNTRKFNLAANEKSSRDLRGYVRCKIGTEQQLYLRSGHVTSYVALEFQEQTVHGERSFVLGAKIDSPDEEARTDIRWFSLEGHLGELTFLVDDRPATNEEFRFRGERVKFILQLGDARERFRIRLGRLDDRFFEMIPKSLAFKPMDNVKQFINRFILPENTISVVTLRQNIATLKEFEQLLAETKRNIERLTLLLAKHEGLQRKKREIKLYDLLLQKAELEAKRAEAQELARRLAQDQVLLTRKQAEEREHAARCHDLQERRIQLEVAQRDNKLQLLIQEMESKLRLLRQERAKWSDQVSTLQAELVGLQRMLAELDKYGVSLLAKEEWLLLRSVLDEGTRDIAVDPAQAERRLAVLVRLQADGQQIADRANEELARLRLEQAGLLAQRAELEREIEGLRAKKLKYPDHTMRLKRAIEEEFARQGIDAPVRIFCELLEIREPRWHDAVEAYLNTQRFYLLVEPRLYPLALDVYQKVRKTVHSVGLVNTGKLEAATAVDEQSLAHVVVSEHRYARMYADFLLARVIRCDDVQQLKEHKVAVTADCMLYQNLAVRKMNEELYRTPFIGAHALEVQLRLREADLQRLQVQLQEMEQASARQSSILQGLKWCRLETLAANDAAPAKRAACEQEIVAEEQRLAETKAEPDLLVLQMQLDECKRSLNQAETDANRVREQLGGLRRDIEHRTLAEQRMRVDIEGLDERFDAALGADADVGQEALKKFAEQQQRQKTAAQVVENFAPYRTKLDNDRRDMKSELIELQKDYCRDFQAGFAVDGDDLDEYVAEHHKLVSADLVRYEEDLLKAKDNCQLEFRESFLARLKERIEDARNEFHQLNRALRDIYYGDDRYSFEIKQQKQKQAIYKMIVSEWNEAGQTLWSQSFDEQFKDEMEELFAKLTAYDDRGEQVLAEYTDYRAYLDYDILVERRDGSRQRFSHIYGDKSGGETQTPYYVAIAASFLQLYRSGDTIRIMMLDEAFDKMDDSRIEAMLDFFNSQQFQVILAAPTPKMEVIAEKVDTVLTAIRVGNESTVVRYYF